jgi:glycine cleavage system H lipoate-binding protein
MSISFHPRPDTGEVTAINGALNEKPERLNENANGTWIIKVAIKRLREIHRARNCGLRSPQ